MSTGDGGDRGGDKDVDVVVVVVGLLLWPLLVFLGHCLFQKWFLSLGLTT